MRWWRREKAKGKGRKREREREERESCVKGRNENEGMDGKMGRVLGFVG